MGPTEYLQIVLAALGGGSLYKVVDVLMKKRLNDARADNALSDAAGKQIVRLEVEIERVTKAGELFKVESTKCRQDYEELRLIVTDLKIALRGVYEYMLRHSESCPELGRVKPPTISDSLLH